MCNDRFRTHLVVFILGLSHIILRFPMSLTLAKKYGCGKKNDTSPWLFLQFKKKQHHIFDHVMCLKIFKLKVWWGTSSAWWANIPVFGSNLFEIKQDGITPQVQVCLSVNTVVICIAVPLHVQLFTQRVLYFFWKFSRPCMLEKPKSTQDFGSPSF